MYKKILVPLDGSELSERALPYVENLAKGMGCHVLILSVCEYGEMPERLAWQYLSIKAKEFESRGINASPVVALGDASDGIVDFSEKNAVDLIIMSTHGRAGISRWATGSVCNKVIQESHVPLLLVRAMASTDMFNNFRKILIPLDGSRFSEITIPYATDIANALNSEITLLEINEAGEFHGQLTPELIPTWEEYREKAVNGTANAIDKYLSELRDRIGLRDSTVQLKTVRGKAAEEIINFAESNDVGMIALSTHGWSGFSHWVLGSVANKIASSSSKPTLLVRPKAATSDSSTQLTEIAT